jgi:hypothetical protein
MIREKSMSSESKRGKSPKAGKGVGRKPAPEVLEPITVRIPATRAKWLRENIKPISGGISGWFSDAVKSAMDLAALPSDINKTSGDIIAASNNAEGQK